MEEKTNRGALVVRYWGEALQVSECSGPEKRCSSSVRLALTAIAFGHLVIVATGLAAGPVASASTDAYNRRSAERRLPSNPLERPVCVQRSIWLAQGTYRWRMYDR